MSYPGGKALSGTYQKIINQIPPHSVYVEMFFGGGAIMRYKKPARLNIGLDLDQAVIGAAIATYGDNGQQQTRAGTATNGVVGCIDNNGEASAQYQFVCADGVEWLKGQLFPKDTFVYADPPYVMSSRKQQRKVYNYEMTDDDHRQMIAVLSQLRCRVMISGYPSSLYDELLANWRTITFQAVTRGGTMATECLWLNYPEPSELHDSQYLGDNYREREVFAKRKKRFIAKLNRLPLLERQSLLDAVDDWRSSTAIIGVAEAQESFS